MRLLTASVLFLLFTLTANAQPTVKGSVNDTAAKKLLPNAVVALIQKKDSALYKFVRTAKDGSFVIPHVAPGKYQLLITYPKFADYTDDVEIKTEALNVGSSRVDLQACKLEYSIVSPK